MSKLRAYLQGVVDGLEQPHDLTSGMSYGDDRDEIYDRGANMGQWLGRIRREVRRGPKAQEDT